jgi:hypothetical protein
VDAESVQQEAEAEIVLGPKDEDDKTKVSQKPQQRS